MNRLEFPAFEVYCDYQSNNYGVNALCFTLPQGRFWFSYKTLVAFWTLGEGRVVRENEWGPTTGKHLNAIDGGDKKERVSSHDFEILYSRAFRGSCKEVLR